MGAKVSFPSSGERGAPLFAAPGGGEWGCGRRGVPGSTCPAPRSAPADDTKSQERRGLAPALHSRLGCPAPLRHQSRGQASARGTARGEGRNWARRKIPAGSPGAAAAENADKVCHAAPRDSGGGRSCTDPAKALSASSVRHSLSRGCIPISPLPHTPTEGKTKNPDCYEIRCPAFLSTSEYHVPCKTSSRAGSHCLLGPRSRGD